MTLTKRKNPHLKYRKTIFFLLFATLLVAGSSFGWVKFQQEQERKIILAQSLLIKECKEQTEADNFSETSKNVNQAVKLLQSVPKLPGETYPEAQKELTKFSECIKAVDAKSSFLNAENLSKKAFSVDNQTVLPIEEWQKIRFQLETAIVDIQNIPTDVDVSKQAQSKLSKYQNQLKLINQKTQNEQIAVNALSRARKLKSQAENIVRFNNLKSFRKHNYKLIMPFKLLIIFQIKQPYLKTKKIIWKAIKFYWITFNIKWLSFG